jgi:hypothetical protein
MVCYEVRNIQWEHDGRDDDMSRYPTQFEFIDNRFNGVGAVDPVGHILKSIEEQWGHFVRSFTLVDEHGFETVFSK